MNLPETIEQYHRALDAFSRGTPGPVKDLFSRAGDVTLANPFGPAVRGWDAVSAALDFASSRFRDGAATGFTLVASYEADTLATVVETEQWQARVSERADVTPWELRVTSTFRLENREWKLVHRHADPIATADELGPLRTDDRRAGAEPRHDGRAEDGRRRTPRSANEHRRYG
jgi:hypothetical protein